MLGTSLKASARWLRGGGLVPRSMGPPNIVILGFSVTGVCYEYAGALHYARESVTVILDFRKEG